MGDTSDAVRNTLSNFAESKLPPELIIANRLQAALKKTDRNLADPDGSRDTLLVMLLIAVVEMEGELRSPQSRKIVVDLPKDGL